ncbi:putative oxidoreductase [Bordetella holmesii 30539]|nr:putative oxidoreductase [Bordetella holmesii ATCC 51541]AIT26385.1 putative oxidoreductase [Bordetella holmesii 44057]EWM41526.1 putative oxidoreductase [Bordetella holmesii 41130]EWM46958.1 putative oxidoreductase [Bordetella holmesii 35009]EWM51132.1 putative oxidoreductase [Bordetella holmesii 70147]EXF89985.1 putative oxidoreductase [Bordetella holmesii 30539]EXX96193.1 putative oxidoreductase [Bordetella holmesii 1058]KAK77685.1 short chain dehydrogenase family protein [Bordetella ho
MVITEGAHVHSDMQAPGGEPGRVGGHRHALPMPRGGSAEEVAAGIMCRRSPPAFCSIASSIDVSGG